MNFAQDHKPLRKMNESSYIQELPKIMISSREQDLGTTGSEGQSIGQ